MSYAGLRSVNVTRKLTNWQILGSCGQFHAWPQTADHEWPFYNPHPQVRTCARCHIIWINRYLMFYAQSTAKDQFIRSREREKKSIPTTGKVLIHCLWLFTVCVSLFSIKIYRYLMFHVSSQQRMVMSGREREKIFLAQVKLWFIVSWHFTVCVSLFSIKIDRYLMFHVSSQQRKVISGREKEKQESS